MSIFNYENDLENIRQKLAYIRANVELAAESRHFDINIELENFVGDLLNLVYDYDLINTNRAISNAPGIDLQDEDLGIAVQVTSRKDSPKIKETIKQFNDKKLYKSFDRLIVFIITSKKGQYRAAFDTEGNFTFDRNRDIMDFSDVVRDLINENDHARIGRVSEFLNDNIAAAVKSVTEDITAPPFLAEFLGREDELRRVQERLKANQHLVLVNGLGGIGKSALARKLYHEIRCRYDRVGWVSYQNTFKESLILAMVAEQFQSMDDPNQRYKATYSYLKQDKKTLLVVDDVTQDALLDPELQEVSALSNVSMLLTSRKSSITGFETVPIDNLPEETCVQLFYRYSNHHHKETEENTAVIGEIVRRAYYHTLLVELLAKASVHESSLAAYLAKLEQNVFDPNDFKVDSVAQQQKRVSDHLRKLYQLADFAAEPEKSRILWNFAIMPTMDIPREANEWIGADLNKLQELIEAGWLSNRDGSYYMHGLVKEIILQERQEGKIPEGTADAFFCYVSENDFFPKAQAYTEKQVRYAILDSALSYVDQEDYTYLGELYLLIANAAQDLAGHCRDIGKYEDAEQYSLEALVFLEKIDVIAHLNTCTTESNFAGLFQNMGRYEEYEKV